MKDKKTLKKHNKYNAFDIVNCIFLLISSLACVLPIIHILAISLSSNVAAAAGKVTFWPVEPQLTAYRYVLKQPQFWRSFMISAVRTTLSIVISITLTIITAYPLSKDNRKLKGRTIYTWYFFVTMLFNGGLVPVYMNIRQLGLLNSIFALVLPGALNVFNLVLLINFFRTVPIEMEEAAFVDGAGHWRILWQIYVPVSKAAIATLILFVAVFNWNSWFDGILFMNNTRNYPLQSYMQTVIIERDFSSYMNMTLEELEEIMKLSSRSLVSAQIFIAAAPILLIYPYLQKYFVKGIVIGSVKG